MNFLRSNHEPQLFTSCLYLPSPPITLRACCLGCLWLPRDAAVADGGLRHVRLSPQRSGPPSCAANGSVSYAAPINGGLGCHRRPRRPPPHVAWPEGRQSIFAILIQR